MFAATIVPTLMNNPQNCSKTCLESIWKSAVKDLRIILIISIFFIIMLWQYQLCVLCEEEK